MRDNLIYTNDYIDYLTGAVIPSDIPSMEGCVSKDVLEEMGHIDTCMNFYSYLETLPKDKALESLQVLEELIHQLHGKCKL